MLFTNKSPLSDWWDIIGSMFWLSIFNSLRFLQWNLKRLATIGHYAITTHCVHCSCSWWLRSFDSLSLSWKNNIIFVILYAFIFWLNRAISISRLYYDIHLPAVFIIKVFFSTFWILCIMNSNSSWFFQWDRTLNLAFAYW